MLWLLATHPIALGLFAAAPYFWINRDARDFAKDPAADKFHTTFHRQRLTWRVGFALLAAGLASWPLLVGHQADTLSFFVSVLGLLAIGAGWWGYVFNPGLNVARQLDYVPRYYVSFSPTAAFFPDRMIADYLKKKVGMTPTVAPHVASAMLQPQAGKILKRLLTAGLVAGVGVYLLSVVLLLL